MLATCELVNFKRLREHYGELSATLHEALGDLGGLLSFWSELGWLERSSGDPHQWPYVQRTVPDQPSAEKAQEQKKKKKISADNREKFDHMGIHVRTSDPTKLNDMRS
ncbi:jg19093 [Pararge aegeria aegeria]|uniref:Jg19093 protein n=1 Tax=Pararge aegeria aegeria TaxID=348720 RepID=A0A8S4SLP0_9NEOP|nr:jg19093 [Pararge aegeria aegeria]